MEKSINYCFATTMSKRTDDTSGYKKSHKRHHVSGELLSLNFGVDLNCRSVEEWGLTMTEPRRDPNNVCQLLNQLGVYFLVFFLLSVPKHSQKWTVGRVGRSSRIWRTCQRPGQAMFRMLWGRSICSYQEGVSGWLILRELVIWCKLSLVKDEDFERKKWTCVLLVIVIHILDSIYIVKIWSPLTVAV